MLHGRILYTRQIQAVRLVVPLKASVFASHFARPISSAATDYESKYAEQIRRRAEEKGLSVAELKQKLKAEIVAQERKKREAAATTTTTASEKEKSGAVTLQSTPSSSPSFSAINVHKERKDSSPVKALSSILNLSKLLKTPHDPSQISALWHAYHLSRSGATGRGFLCASIPVEQYNSMSGIARRYPQFVAPLLRKTDAEPQKSESQAGYEMFFLQWDFHGSPPVPSDVEDPFSGKAALLESVSGTANANPQTSTVLLTPLQEYKSRQSFATPYLVLTHYTDLVATHGVVLLRGEITPSSSGVGDRYLLTQEDAQRLAMIVQKFYLWSNSEQGDSPEAKLLRTFHEDPEKFDVDELVKHAELLG